MSVPKTILTVRSFRRRPDYVLALLLLVLVAGCATTGPRISREEIREAQHELEAKSFLRMAEQQSRVWVIGHRLIESLPDDPHRHEPVYPDLGLRVSRINGRARRVFGYENGERGLYVFAVRLDGPAMRAGLRQGDLVVALDAKRCASVRRFLSQESQLKPGETATVTVKRDGRLLDLPVEVGSRNMNVRFVVSNEQGVNAWAKRRHEIGVTGGLVRFVQSDDELAVILGHELAHITESHFGKTIATGIFSAVLGVTLGVVSEVAAPGSGGAVMNVADGLAESAFSREFEREADYKGLLHTYRAGYDVSAGVTVWERFGTELPLSRTLSLQSTHPAAPERMVRIRKVAGSLMTDGLEATIARYEHVDTNVAGTTSVRESRSGHSSTAHTTSAPSPGSWHSGR